MKNSRLEAYKDKPENTTEAKLIFLLADYLRACSCDEIYSNLFVTLDIAERLFCKWKLVEEEGITKGIDKSMKIISNKLSKILRPVMYELKCKSKIIQLEKDKKRLQRTLSCVLKKNHNNEAES